jgi:hypothetical protein
LEANCLGKLVMRDGVFTEEETEGDAKVNAQPLPQTRQKPQRLPSTKKDWFRLSGWIVAAFSLSLLVTYILLGVIF